MICTAETGDIFVQQPPRSSSRSSPRPSTSSLTSGSKVVKVTVRSAGGRVTTSSVESGTSPVGTGDTVPLLPNSPRSPNSPGSRPQASPKPAQDSPVETMIDYPSSSSAQAGGGLGVGAKPKTPTSREAFFASSPVKSHSTTTPLVPTRPKNPFLPSSSAQSPSGTSPTPPVRVTLTSPNKLPNPTLNNPTPKPSPHNPFTSQSGGIEAGGVGNPAKTGTNPFLPAPKSPSGGLQGSSSGVTKTATVTTNIGKPAVIAKPTPKPRVIQMSKPTATSLVTQQPSNPGPVIPPTTGPSTTPKSSVATTRQPQRPVVAKVTERTESVGMATSSSGSNNTSVPAAGCLPVIGRLASDLSIVKARMHADGSTYTVPDASVQTQLPSAAAAASVPLAETNSDQREPNSLVKNQLEVLSDKENDPSVAFPTKPVLNDKPAVPSNQPAPNNQNEAAVVGDQPQDLSSHADQTSKPSNQHARASRPAASKSTGTPPVAEQRAPQAAPRRPRVAKEASPAPPSTDTPPTATDQQNEKVVIVSCHGYTSLFSNTGGLHANRRARGIDSQWDAAACVQLCSSTHGQWQSIFPLGNFPCSFETKLKIA